MAVRYSNVRLEDSGNVKRLCLAALEHLLKHVPDADHARLGTLRRHVGKFRESMVTPFVGMWPFLQQKLVLSGAIGGGV